LASSNSNAQIAAALIGAAGAVSVAVIANWHSIFPDSAQKAPSPSALAGAPPPAAQTGFATPTPAVGAPFRAPSSDFIFPQSADQPLSPADLAGLSVARIRIARNEIYARHGFIFRSPDLEQYFARYQWYRPAVSQISLSPVEQQNVALLQQAERARGGG
jgi:YARHG domain